MIVPPIVFQPLEGSTVRIASIELQQFREKHADWLAIGHSDDDGVSYSLHPQHLDACLALYKIDVAATEAEKEFAKICDRNGAIGIYQDRFVKYSLLKSPLAWPTDLDLTEFLKLGWTAADIATLKNFPESTEKVNHRLRSAAGRLVSMPSFLAARDRIRESWIALPPTRRPWLPIARSARVDSVDQIEVQSVDAADAKFIQEFDAFCNDWCLMGMASWNLPDPQGPHWTPGMASDCDLRGGKLAVMTPWHFHVLAEDGLGHVLEAEHRHQAAERGIDDGGSWETYAHILDVYFWELVLSSRYGRAERVAKFKTTMDFVLAEILGLAVSRIKRLRTWISALKRGTLTSLAGKR